MKKCKEKLTKTQKARLQAQFDYACDMFKKSDIGGARELILENWKDMLPLFDCKTLLQMVHPITILQNYDVLCEREKYIRTAQGILKQTLEDSSTDEFRTMLELYPDELRDFGIDPDLYAEAFAKNYAEDFIGEIDSLPEILNANRMIENVSMQSILENTSWWKFSDFLRKFIEAGGDISLIGKKFLDEIGYSCEYDEQSALFDLLDAGYSDIDIAYLADCVDTDVLNNEDKHRYYSILKENGADRTILARFAA